jgi:cell division protein FtsB
MMASYGMFGETRRRRRREAWWRVIRFMSAVVAVFAVGMYAYQVGVSANQAHTAQLEADLVRFQQSNLDLRDRIASISKQSADADAALESMRRRYAAEIPSGEAADLVAQLREQLAAGVEPGRLALLIEVAGLEDACQSEPVTKRFMPRTPVSAGPFSYVRFHDRITVTGAGESARNEAGLPEAWYDPAQPVRLEFRTLDGGITTMEGIVPFTHRMVVDGKEYRFSAIPGEPRFLEVTAQACPLPESGDGSSASAAHSRERRAHVPSSRPLTD